MSQSPDVEIPFADGNVTGAARVGATVRRATGPWTPAIHLLLSHLERVGFAHAAWRFVPLYDDPAFGTPAEQAHRLRLFRDAYGLDECADLLTTIRQRQRALHESIAAWAAAGDPAFVALWRGGDAAMILKDSAYLARNRRAFASALAAG